MTDAADGLALAREQRALVLDAERFSRGVLGGTLASAALESVAAQVEVDRSRVPVAGLFGSDAGYGPDVDNRLIAAVGVCSALDVMGKGLKWTSACMYVGYAVDAELRDAAERGTEGEYERRGRMLHRMRRLGVGVGVGLRQPACAKLGLYVLGTVMRVTGLMALQTVQTGPRMKVRYCVPTAKTREWIAAASALRPYYRPVTLPTEAVPDGEVLAVGRGASEPGASVEIAVERLRRTAWAVNDRVLEVARQMYAARMELAGCVSDEDAAYPVYRPEANWMDWKRAMGLVGESNALRASRRVKWGQAVATGAELAGKSLHYPHHCDFRGRMHVSGTMLSVQSGDLSKALMVFADGRALGSGREGERAWFWATEYGAKLYLGARLTFEERLAWVERSWWEIEHSADDPIGHRWWAEAKEPMCFLAWALEIVSARRNRSYPWRLPVKIDGSNNGLQMYALMMRDPVLGAAVNCSATRDGAGRVVARDSYSEVAGRVTAMLTPEWRSDLGGSVPRELAKMIVMRVPYGASWWGQFNAVATWLMPRTKRIHTFKEMQVVFNLLWEETNRTVAVPKMAMAWMARCADAASEAGGGGGLDMRWTTPSGFRVHQAYNKQSKSKLVVLGFGRGMSLSTRVTEDTGKVDGFQQRNGVAPNVIQSLDAAVMAGCVAGLPDGMPAYTVFDEVGSLPLYMDAVAETVRRSAKATFTGLVGPDKGDYLRYLWETWTRQVGKPLPEPPEQGTMDPAVVMESPYFFS